MRLTFKPTALTGALLLGGSAGFASSIGCPLPDTCIKVVTSEPSEIVCKPFTNAEGTDSNGELVDPIVDETNTLPIGCLCFPEDDADILINGDPQSDEFLALEEILDVEVRQACLDLAIDLMLESNNCSTDDVIGDPASEGPGNCGDDMCSFVNPPLGGSCPDECIVDDDGGGTGDTGDTEFDGFGEFPR